jgi:hypothetical protein
MMVGHGGLQNGFRTRTSLVTSLPISRQASCQLGKKFILLICIKKFTPRGQSVTQARHKTKQMRLFCTLGGRKNDPIAAYSVSSGLPHSGPVRAAICVRMKIWMTQ